MQRYPACILHREQVQKVVEFIAGIVRQRRARLIDKQTNRIKVGHESCWRIQIRALGLKGKNLRHSPRAGDTQYYQNQVVLRFVVWLK